MPLPFQLIRLDLNRLLRLSLEPRISNMPFSLKLALWEFSCGQECFIKSLYKLKLKYFLLLAVLPRNWLDPPWTLMRNARILDDMNKNLSMIKMISSNAISIQSTNQRKIVKYWNWCKIDFPWAKLDLYELRIKFSFLELKLYFANFELTLSYTVAFNHRYLKSIDIV